MPSADTSGPSKSGSPGAAHLLDGVLRGLLAVDAVLLVLTFIPAFAGSEGLADRLWGGVRFDGWRADVAWMCGSSLLILAGGLLVGNELRLRRTTVRLCWLWLPCFLLYLGYTLLHMFG